MPVRIVIFEDNDRLRQSLAFLLQCQPLFEVCGDYGDCLNATEIVRSFTPDVVLMDIDMPGQSGIEGVRVVKETRPETSVIMYTVFEDNDKLFQCLCAGANGYILKKTAPSKLFDAIQEVLDGGAPLSPSVARKVLDSFKQKSTNIYNLTAREMEVLTLLGKGFSSKMISSELFISFDTTRSHLKNIYHKLHVNCGKEAIAKALREHII
ncbi:MAG: response regulator transcription factor [Saprospiraceae bacterium]|nr:response regulator transcription factor [Saprospiraceae bacterium]